MTKCFDMKLKILFYLCVQLFGNITLSLVSLLYTINRAPVDDVSVYYIAERIILNKDFSFFFSFISVGKFRSFKGFVKKCLTEVTRNQFPQTCSTNLSKLRIT